MIWEKKWCNVCNNIQLIEGKVNVQNLNVLIPERKLALFYQANIRHVIKLKTPKSRRLCFFTFNSQYQWHSDWENKIIDLEHGITSCVEEIIMLFHSVWSSEWINLFTCQMKKKRILIFHGYTSIEKMMLDIKLWRMKRIIIFPRCLTKYSRISVLFLT